VIYVAATFRLRNFKGFLINPFGGITRRLKPAATKDYPDKPLNLDINKFYN
jgi:hypothetical protein